MTRRISAAAASVRQHVVAQLAEPFERHLHYPVRVPARDLGRAVGRIRIGDKDLVGPGDASKRGFNLVGFVVGDDVDGDSRHSGSNVQAQA
jgi:hypothetical protein